MHRLNVRALGPLLLAMTLLGCSKTPQQWLELGQARAAEGQHEKALASFDHALEKPGADRSVVQLARARSLYALKRWPDCANAALASTIGQSAGMARPARLLALQALAEAGDKSDGATVLALLGPDAANDPAVQVAAGHLGLSVAEAPGGMPSSKAKRGPFELASTNALNVDISAVQPSPSADPTAFPVRAEFQDPRLVVKVRSPDGKALVWRGLDKGVGYFLFLSVGNGAPKRLDACHNGYQPVWSPDSKRILYSAMDWKDEDRNLFVYDLTTGKSRRLFQASRKVGPLASWSPDGSKIVFTYFDELWITNTSGIGRGMLNLGGRLKMDVTDARLFAWSRDGKRLAYAARGGDKVYLIDLTSKI